MTVGAVLAVVLPVSVRPDPRPMSMAPSKVVPEAPVSVTELLAPVPKSMKLVATPRVTIPDSDAVPEVSVLDPETVQPPMALLLWLLKKIWVTDTGALIAGC